MAAVTHEFLLEIVRRMPRRQNARRGAGRPRCGEEVLRLRAPQEKYRWLFLITENLDDFRCEHTPTTIHVAAGPPHFHRQRWIEEQHALSGPGIESPMRRRNEVRRIFRRDRAMAGHLLDASHHVVAQGRRPS